MSKLSPSQSRKRERGIESFTKHWGIDFKTFEIKHNGLKCWDYFLSFFWRKKHRVSSLYWWCVRRADDIDFMVFDDPIKHDDIPLKGYARKYQLINDWHIPDEDLKYLFDGPLADIDGSILVKEGTSLSRLWSIVSQLRPLTVIIPFLLALYRYRSEISELWNSVSSAI
jgi:hypothetical protein